MQPETKCEAPEPKTPMKNCGARSVTPREKAPHQEDPHTRTIDTPGNSERSWSTKASCLAAEQCRPRDSVMQDRCAAAGASHLRDLHCCEVRLERQEQPIRGGREQRIGLVHARRVIAIHDRVDEAVHAAVHAASSHRDSQARMQVRGVEARRVGLGDTHTKKMAPCEREVARSHIAITAPLW